MKIPLIRMIVFVADVQKCANFYRKVFGFKLIPSKYEADEWMELDTGGARLAFHKARGPKGPVKTPTGSNMDPHKIVFYAKNVAKARAAVVARGAKMGQAKTFGELTLCDGKDPEGHAFQISNRP